MKDRESFVFYRSFYEALQDLDAETRLKLYDAIADYSLNLEEPELTGIANTIFKLIKPQIEANNKRYLNGCKPKNKQTKSKPQAKNKQEESKTETNVNDNVNDNVNEKDSNILNLENEFQGVWKDYTLTFLKSQGRAGGSKQKSIANYKKLRSKYSKEKIDSLIENHKKLKLGHKDLERLLRDDYMKQFMEDGTIDNSSSGIVPAEWIGKRFTYNECKCEFTKKGYFNISKDYEITNRDDVKKIVEEIKETA